MNKLTSIVTIISLVWMIVFALLMRVWGGFVYFVLGLACLLSLFWFVYNIIRYYSSFQVELKERYGLFKADKINKMQISLEEYNKNEQAYVKEFQKTCIKSKVMFWLLTLFCLAVAITFLLGMIFYKK